MWKMIRWHKWATFFAWMGMLVSVAGAQMRLPLQGYYRPGRCMPVLVEAHDTSIDLLGDGIVPAHVMPGRVGIVPLLTLRSDASLNSSTTLHPLGSDERLVGTTMGNRTIAATLFPGKKIISIDLDASAPLPGPAIGWGSLDAVVLGEKIDSDRVGNFLNAGIVVAVLGNERPDARWPWQRMGVFWILQNDLVGPTTVIGTEAAYAPMQSWHSTQPATLRWRIVIVGVVACLLMMLPLLLRSRWTIVAMLAMAMICTAAIESWRRDQPTLWSASGDIVVDSGDLRQIDAWRYFLSPHGGAGQFASDTLPIVLDSHHAAQIDLRLQCNADGADAWEFTLPADGQLAFLTRTISAGKISGDISATSRSPLYELARQDYLDANARIVGEIVPADNSWPAVVIGHK
jgi:hypothetical protein